MTSELNTVEITTNCSCVYFDDDENQLQSDECFGCGDDSLEYLEQELGYWLDANGLDDSALIRINASGLGWQRRDGYKDTRADELSKALFIDGDFTIRYTFSNDYKELTAVRYSHDEPTGTGVITFSLSPFAECCRCGEVDECTNLDGELFCPTCERMERD